MIHYPLSYHRNASPQHLPQRRPLRATSLKDLTAHFDGFLKPVDYDRHPDASTPDVNVNRIAG